MAFTQNSICDPPLCKHHLEIKQIQNLLIVLEAQHNIINTNHKNAYSITATIPTIQHTRATGVCQCVVVPLVEARVLVLDAAVPVRVEVALVSG